jgi:hypothetical protein
VLSSVPNSGPFLEDTKVYHLWILITFGKAVSTSAVTSFVLVSVAPHFICHGQRGT